MTELVDRLDQLGDVTLDTVVHVGAGSGWVIEQYTTLPPARRPRRLILIEGDAEAAEHLAREAATIPWATVVEAAVAARSGPLQWHRYNVPALNGPLDALALKSHYPRLRRTQSRTVEARTLDEVLASIGVEAPAGPGAALVLVMDVPGQEHALLTGLTEARQQHLDVLLLKSCADLALVPVAQSLQATIELARTRHYSTVSIDSDSEPLWPMATLRLDRSGHALAQSQRRVGELEALLLQCNAELTEAAKASAQLARLKEQLDAQSKLGEKREGEMELLRDSVAKFKSSKDEAAKAAATHKRSLDSMRLQLIAKQKDLDECSQELHRLREQVRILDEELAKAEGQLAMARDLLLAQRHPLST